MAREAAAVAQRRALATDADDAEGDDDDDEEEGPAASKAKAVKGKKGKAASGGGSGVCSVSGADTGVDYSAHECRVTISLPLSAPKLLMLEVVERVAAAVTVRATPGIDKVGEQGALLLIASVDLIPALNHLIH